MVKTGLGSVKLEAGQDNAVLECGKGKTLCMASSGSPDTVVGSRFGVLVGFTIMVI